MQLKLSEEEFALFMASLRSTLPITFRFSLGSPTSLLRQLKSFDLSPINMEWFKSAWQINCSKADLKKKADFKKFHTFLQNETSTGNISRQEAVSMIPPLFLDIQPHHIVLDMCAAPGSKTAQIIEQLHAVNVTPPGCVVANDSDYQRAKMLVHQSKRLNSPCVIVTHHPAQSFPTLAIPSTKEILLFDRILCDVPCSGDATLRKNLMIWKTFSPHAGNALHPLQLSILKRATSILRKGGRIVYSTCSFNPVENEAVVMQVIRESKGALRIVDASKMYPSMKRVPGLTKWSVVDKKGEIVESPQGKFVESMFVKEDVVELGVEKCMRFYPHLMDTGGFFVTIIEKIPDEMVVAMASPIIEEEEVQERLSKKQKRLTKESPFIPLPISSETTLSLTSHYGLTTFPSACLHTRSEEHFKMIYLLSESATKILTVEKLKIINAGVQVFKRNESSTKLDGRGCDFRITSDGICTVYPFLDKRIIDVAKEALQEMLEREYTRFCDMPKEIGEQCISLGEGCLVFRVSVGEESVPVPVWRGKGSVNILLGKMEKEALFMRMCGKELKIIKYVKADVNSEDVKDTECMNDNTDDASNDEKANILRATDENIGV